MNPKPHRVGVITMHYPNSGSALQAYATQVTLENLGYDVEIIDYKYPTKWHFERRGSANADERVGGLTAEISRLLRRLKKSICKRVSRDEAPLNGEGLKLQFIKAELNLSDKRYGSPDQIKNNPPVYDLYLTGSDQVWNPRFAVGDTVFMCDFAPDGIARISYASSFATDSIPEEYRAAYREHLGKYRAISVRERTGIKLTRELTGQEARLVCDPTLLLEKPEWDRLADQSSLNFSEPYMLIYTPTYAFDPYPGIERLIEDARRQRGMKMVYLTDMGELRSDFDHCREAYAGPKEFVRLLRDACLVITTSFHGTAFSLLYEKNFYSVVDSLESTDSRILDLLKEMGAEDRAVPVTARELVVRDIDYLDITRQLNEFRKRSGEYLGSALASCLPRSRG